MQESPQDKSKEMLLGKYQGTKKCLAEKLISMTSNLDAVDLILSRIKTDEESQRVLDYIDTHINLSIYSIRNYSQKIEFERISKEYRSHEYVNPYEEAKKSFLRKSFQAYPNISFDVVELSFMIRSVNQNTPLLYSILESFPEKNCQINGKDVHIHIESEDKIVEQIALVLDVITMVRTWKSTSLYINGVKIELSSQLDYVLSYLSEKHNIQGLYWRRDINQIKKHYQPRTAKPRPITSDYKNRSVILSKDNLNRSLSKVIETYVDIYGRNKSVEYYDINQHDRVIVIENSLIIDFRIIPKPWRWEELDVEDWMHPEILIQELTHNDLFKFNWADFRRKFIYSGVCIDYFKFHGMDYYRKCIDNFNVVDKALPELELRERYQEYSGERYHILILKMEDVEGKEVYGVGYTKNQVKVYINRLCKVLQEKSSSALIGGVGCLPYRENRSFINAFLSWKGKKRLWRIENKFSYCFVDVYVKNDHELYDLPSEYLRAAYTGSYSNMKFGTYHKPVNPWKSEELVYNITQKIFKDYQVLYQYRPHFLFTDKGNMSYDVYICGLKIAIEYQGKQHFEPVEYFGGEENYERQKQRDEIKAKISEKNGIKLIYIYYWEDITPELIKEKVDLALKS